MRLHGYLVIIVATSPAHIKGIKVMRLCGYMVMSCNIELMYIPNLHKLCSNIDH